MAGTEHHILRVVGTAARTGYARNVVHFSTVLHVTAHRSLLLLAQTAEQAVTTDVSSEYVLQISVITIINFRRPLGANDVRCE